MSDSHRTHYAHRDERPRFPHEHRGNDRVLELERQLAEEHHRAQVLEHKIQSLESRLHTTTEQLDLALTRFPRP